MLRSQGTYDQLLAQAEAHRDALGGGLRGLRSRAMEPAQKVPKTGGNGSRWE